MLIDTNSKWWPGFKQEEDLLLPASAAGQQEIAKKKAKAQKQELFADKKLELQMIGKRMIWKRTLYWICKINCLKV